MKKKIVVKNWFQELEEDSSNDNNQEPNYIVNKIENKNNNTKVDKEIFYHTTRSYLLCIKKQLVKQLYHIFRVDKQLRKGKDQYYTNYH